MYNILIAPDSFKGTLTALEVCDIVGKAFSDKINNVNITKLPVADGGEGLCSCLYLICGGKYISAKVTGVFGQVMDCQYLMLDNNTAVIEMASCAGLPLAADYPNPEKATTYGVGELVIHAVNNGAKEIFLGLGGSATNDCGIGMAAALGYQFLDELGNSIIPIGENLSKIKTIIKPKEEISIPVIAACDVDNPLFGPNGAAYIFAPQKGANAEMVERLDSGLRNISDVIKNDLGKDVSLLPGSGAAGGLGAGAIAFINAELHRGIDMILDSVDFDKKAANADLVITGEGRLDFQSLNGKVISGIASRTKKTGTKLFTICGCKGVGAEEGYSIGISRMFFSTTGSRPFGEIVKSCKEDLYSASVKAAEEFLLTQKNDT